MKSYDVIPLKLVEKNAILAALSFTFDNKDLTAKLLGISRTTLFRKLKSYKIENSREMLDKWLNAQREVAETVLIRSVNKELMERRKKFYHPRKVK